MTSRVSFAVCQCHGTRQPDASLSSTHAAPQRGLPRRIPAVAQAGMSGIAMKFNVCGFKVIIWSSAWIGTGSPTAAAVPSMMSSAAIRFDRMAISVPLSAASARVCPVEPDPLIRGSDRASTHRQCVGPSLLRRDLEVPLGQLVERAGRGHESALLRVPTPGIADGGLAVLRRLLAVATVGFAGLGLDGEGYDEGVVLRPFVGARRIARFLSAVVAAHSFTIDEQGRDLMEPAAAEEQRRHHLVALVGIAVAAEGDEGVGRGRKRDEL